MDYILDNMGVSQRDLINSIINSKFMLDYGKIITVNSDKTVNVQHAVPMTLRYPPKDYDSKAHPTTSYNLEVLYIGSSEFSSSFELKVGDPVLLIGLKDYIDDTQNISGDPNTTFSHYDQNTLKVLPLTGINSSSQTQINIVNGLFQIKTQQMSLYKVISDLISAILSLQTQGAPPYHPSVSAGTIQALQQDLQELNEVLTS